MYVRRVMRVAAGAAMLLEAWGGGVLGPVPPAAAQGSPPIIRFFAVWSEMRPDFTEPHLFINLQADDPDGRVPVSIQSVLIVKPDGGTLDLTNTFRYPNLAFRGEYFLDAGTPVPGTYVATVTDVQGNSVSMNDALNPAPPVAAANVTSPANEELLATSTPTITWEPVSGAGSLRVTIRNADGAQTFGDALYTGPILAGDATSFAVPAGVLDFGRRYVVEVQAHDGAVALPGANNRSVIRRPVSVGGPNISAFVNQSAVTPGQTLRLGVSVRNEGPPVTADAVVWAGVPGGAILRVLEVSDVEIPSTPSDSSAVVDDIASHAFTGAEPAGPYVLGIRLVERSTGATMAQSITGFSFAP